MNVSIEQVKKVIADQMSVSEDKITTSDNLVVDLRIDSLDAVELIMALEDKFDLKTGDLTDELFLKCKTLPDIVSFINTSF